MPRRSLQDQQDRGGRREEVRTVWRKESGFHKPAVSWFSDCYQRMGSVVPLTQTDAHFGDFTHACIVSVSV